MTTSLMLGNEAIARGAWESGVQVAAAYPGTPSTEIVTNLARYDGVYAEWSTNEKVAYEVAFGAAVGGVRALTAMKSAGASVAADPLISSVYTGICAGLVVVVAGDPGMSSGMTEQDDRYFGRISGMPMLEPADSQECKDFVGLAFELSETYDIPVMVRLTCRPRIRSPSCALGEPLPAERKEPGRHDRQVLPAAAVLAAVASQPARTPRAAARVRRGEPARARRARQRRAGARRRRCVGRGLHQRQGGRARRELPQARHGPPAARRDHPAFRGVGRPSLRGRGARAVPRGADPRRRHRRRGQALVLATRRAHPGAGRPRLRRGRSRPAALGTRRRPPKTTPSFPGRLCCAPAARTAAWPRP